MITVCIPVYNFNITSLFNELGKQSKLLEVPVEIICIDDASEKVYQEINKKAVGEKGYIQLGTNIGRARIRNLFLQYAHYENLLFLDCDSILISNNFLENYLVFINQNKNYNVVCGGRIYDNTPPQKNYRLRWLYGMKRESLDVAARNASPNASFMSNNFMIDKKLFSQTQFDERLTQYGHEDTLLGYALQKKNIKISHTDNPIQNGHLENNKEYLEKTEQGIINLISILQYVNNDPDFINDVKLLNVYERIKVFAPVINTSFSFLKPVITFLLSKGLISLSLFDFYKLGILAKSMKCSKQTSVK